MSNDKKPPLDPDSIFATLDQIGNAIDAMTDVVGQLRYYLENHCVEEHIVDFEFDEDGVPIYESGDHIVH